MRFALLHHTAWPGHADHYDLLLQTALGTDDDSRVLETFSTFDDILPDGFNTQPLQRGTPHRRKYLNFEGAVPGGRGIVRRIDAGALTSFEHSPGSGLIAFNLTGTIFKGRYQLTLCDENRFILSALR